MDFAGCGNSGGQYVSLGYHERYDALKLLQEVKARWGVKEFIVWGRSMGAVTAVKLYTLLLQEQALNRLTDIKILGMILDSAFISLKRMVIEVGQTRINMPEFLIKAVFLMVGSSIQERAKFKIAQIQLSLDLDKVRCPVLLLASKQDTFVNHAHSQEIFSKLPFYEHKQLQYTMGEHYEQRSEQTIETIMKFIESKYKLLSGDNPRNLRISNLKQQHSGTGSVQKPSKSLRRYEPKKPTQTQIAQQERIPRPFSGSRGQAVKFTNIITHEFTSVGSERVLNNPDNIIRQYQTQKRIEHNQVKMHIGGKELKAKDGLRSKSKPTFCNKVQEAIISRRNRAEEQARGRSSQHTQDNEQDSHFNIITGKLRKRGRTQKDHIQFQSREEKAHINSIRFENSNAQDLTQIQPLSQKPKKLSMTAQQYKNSQVKLLKGVIHLSPSNKRKLAKTKNWQQSKSMSNLNSAPQGISSKFNLMQNIHLAFKESE